MYTKYNKMFVLAIAGLTLAVMASGTAFAQSYWYTNALMSDVQSSSYAELGYSPSGSPNVNYGDNINWYNTYINYDPNYQVYGQVSSYTSPSGGEYVSNQATSGLIPSYGSAQGLQATAQIIGSSGTTYTFDLGHHYYGPYSVYTPYESQTSFHVN